MQLQMRLRAENFLRQKTKGHKLKRKFYIVYTKERKHDAFIEKVVDFLLKLKK